MIDDRLIALFLQTCRCLRAHNVETGQEAWAVKPAHDEAINAMYVQYRSEGLGLVCVYLRAVHMK